MSFIFWIFGLRFFFMVEPTVWDDIRSNYSYYNFSPEIEAENEGEYPLGGFNASRRHSAFMVRIIHKHDEDGIDEMQCAGSLIAVNYILTTAGCAALRRYDGLSNTTIFARSMILNQTRLKWEAGYASKYFESPIIQSFYYQEFWLNHYPDICVARLRDSIDLWGMRKLLKVPEPRRHEMRNYFKECIVYGFDSSYPKDSYYDDYYRMGPIPLAFKAQTVRNYICREHYAAFGDTEDVKQSYEELFCLYGAIYQRGDKNVTGPEDFSEGGPILCNGEFMGILIFYGDWLLPPVGRLYVGQRIDRFYSNIWVAMNKPRTTSPSYVEYPPNKTDLEGIPFFQPTTPYNEDVEEIQEHNSLKLRKIITFVLLIVILSAVVIAFCYCCFLAVKCRCRKEPSEVDPKVPGDKESVVDEGLETEMVENSKEMRVVKDRNLKWFNPRATVIDTVIPFFVLIMALVLTRQIASRFAPGYKPRPNLDGNRTTKKDVESVVDSN